VRGHYLTRHERREDEQDMIERLEKTLDDLLEKYEGQAPTISLDAEYLHEIAEAIGDGTRVSLFFDDPAGAILVIPTAEDAPKPKDVALLMPVHVPENTYTFKRNEQEEEN
jgi:hypothetical protein